MSDIVGDPKAVATVAAATLAFVASLVALGVSAYTQRIIATRQERLQRDLAGQQAGLQRDIESARDAFERARSFDTLTRDRIISRFDDALKSYAVLSTYAQLVGRDAWLRKQGPVAIEDRVQSEASSLRSSLEFLSVMKALPDPDHERCVTACSMLVVAWGRVMGEVTLRGGEDLRDESSAEREFSSDRFVERHAQLRARTDELGTTLFESLARIAVPL
jgi:hypothetical protein